jgi:hypothetical protein
MKDDMHGLGTTMPGPDGKYPRNVIDVFQREDRSAARMIILLMSGVFTIGLIGATVTVLSCRL